MNANEKRKFKAGLKKVKETHARIREVLAECHATIDRYEAAGQPVESPPKR